MDAAACYRIQIQGHLGNSWLRCQGPDFRIAANADDPSGVVTTLTTQLPDQAALLGLLNSLYDANVPLLSIERLEPTAQSEE